MSPIGTRFVRHINWIDKQNFSRAETPSTNISSTGHSPHLFPRRATRFDFGTRTQKPSSVSNEGTNRLYVATVSSACFDVQIVQARS
jgi:hypothetical protein